MTVGTSYTAVGEALSAGSADIGFISGGNYVLFSDDCDVLLTALRFTLAALPWVFFIKRPPIAIKWLAAYGLIFGVAMWALINLGIEWGVPPGTAALLIQFSAFFTLGWGVLLFGERLNRGQVLGIGLAVLGLVSIILASPGQGTTLGYGL